MIYGLIQSLSYIYHFFAKQKERKKERKKEKKERKKEKRKKEHLVISMQISPCTKGRNFLQFHAIICDENLHNMLISHHTWYFISSVRSKSVEVFPLAQPKSEPDGSSSKALLDMNVDEGRLASLSFHNVSLKRAALLGSSALKRQLQHHPRIFFLKKMGFSCTSRN